MAEYLAEHSTHGRVRVQLDTPIRDPDELKKAIKGQIERGNYTTLETDAQPKSILARADDAYRKVAEMATNAVGSAASSGLQGLGVPQDYADPIGQGAAQFLIPQSPIEAGLMIGTMGGGGLAAKAGYKGSKALITRLLGSTAGGAAGGTISEDPLTGAGTGAVTGVATGVVGEGVGMTLGWLSKRVGTLLKGGSAEVVNKTQVTAAQEVGKAFERMPELAGIQLTPTGIVRGKSIFEGFNTPESIRNLVKDPRVGNKLISDAYKEGLDIVLPLAGTGAYYTSPLDPKKFVPFAQAKKELSELFAHAYTPKQANPETANAVGNRAKEMLEEANVNIRKQLAAHDPSGIASAAFDASQTLYKTSINLLKSLRPAFQQKENDRIIFDVAKLQGLYADKQAVFQRSIGQSPFDEMTKALRIAGRMGMQDQPASRVPGSVGVAIPGPLYAREGIASLLQGPPRLVGQQAPLGIARTGTDVLAGRGVAPIADNMMNEME